MLTPCTYVGPSARLLTYSSPFFPAPVTNWAAVPEVIDVGEPDGTISTPPDPKSLSCPTMPLSGVMNEEKVRLNGTPAEPCRRTRLSGRLVFGGPCWP